MKKAVFEEFPIDRAFQFLEPGPVVLVTTKYQGKMNVMTLSWHMVMDFTPKIGFVTGPWNYSFDALVKTKECVIAIPTVDLMEKTVDIGNCSGKDVDKFPHFRLTPQEGASVDAPLIAECLANVECKITDTRLLDRHDLFVLQGVKAWHNPHIMEKRTFHANGNGTFVVDGKTHDLRRRMTRWKDTI